MTSEKENGVSWLHRFATLIAVMTFLLFMVGLVASNTEGTFFVFRQPGLGTKGKISAEPSGKYVHIYWVLAITVIALTIIFGLLLRKSNFPRYLKNLESIAVGALLVIALVVSTPVRGLFPVVEPFAYLFGIQIFFCLAVCLALFTRTDWRWDELKTADLASPSIRQILVFTTVVVFLQPLLGEAFRRKQVGIGTHLVIGIAVTLCSLWVLEMALTKYSHLRTFKVSAIFLAELAGLQLFLGIVSYSMDLNARAFPGRQPGLVVMNITHAAVGMLLLAGSLFVTFQAFKYFAPARSKAFSAVLDKSQTASPQQD